MTDKQWMITFDGRWDHMVVERETLKQWWIYDEEEQQCLDNLIKAQNEYIECMQRKLEELKGE